MNVTGFIVPPSTAAWLFSVYVPSNSTAQLLRRFCNAAGTFVVDRPAAVACVDTALSGYVAVEYPETPPPAAPKTSLLTVVAGVVAAFSHLANNRRERLAPPVAARAAARREVVQTVEKMGAAAFSQIVKVAGRGVV